jgi:hypothetical protein
MRTTNNVTNAANTAPTHAALQTASCEAASHDEAFADVPTQRAGR